MSFKMERRQCIEWYASLESEKKIMTKTDGRTSSNGKELIDTYSCWWYNWRHGLYWFEVNHFDIKKKMSEWQKCRSQNKIWAARVKECGVACNLSSQAKQNSLSQHLWLNSAFKRVSFLRVWFHTPLKFEPNEVFRFIFIFYLQMSKLWSQNRL